MQPIQLPLDQLKHVPRDKTSRTRIRAIFSDPDLATSVRIKRKPKRRKIGRNEPCPCGSGLKFKRCCK